MASRQYQLPTGEYVNADDNSREFQLPKEVYFIEEIAAAVGGRIMSSITNHGGLAGHGGIAGPGGGLAG